MPSLAAALLIVTTLLTTLPAAAETLRIGSIAEEYVAEVPDFTR